MLAHSLRFALCLVWAIMAAPAAQAQAEPHSDLVAQWIASVDGESRKRVLRIFRVSPAGGSGFIVEAAYGWVGAPLAKTAVDLRTTPEGRRLSFTTGSNNQVIVTLAADGTFRGTIAGNNYGPKPVTLVRAEESGDNSTPQGQSLANPESVSSSLRPGERAQLAEILRRAPPEGALKSTLADFYKEQSDAAIKLGDGYSMLHFGRKFAAAAKGTTHEPIADYRHWRAEAEVGDRKVALDLGEALLRHPQTGNARPGIAATLGLNYLQDFYNLKRAEELLAQAQTLQRDVRPSAVRFYFLNAMQIETTRALIENFKGRFKEAIAAGESAAATADKIIVETSTIRRFASADIGGSLFLGHFNAHRLLWESLAVSGQVALAESKATEYYASTILKEKIAGQTLAGYLTVLGGIKWGAQKYEEATAILKRALDIAESAGLPAGSVIPYRASSYLASALVAVGKVDEAMQLCNRRIALKIRYSQTACGLAYHVGGKHEASISVLRSNLKFWADFAAPDSYRVVTTEGLLGAALVAKGEREEGLKLLTNTVALMPDARLRTPGSAGGIYPFVENLIFHALLDGLSDGHSKASDAPTRRALASEAFKVAGMLRTSVVQKSAQDAAMRAAAAEAGLSDLVRTMQDGQAETNSLYEFLTRQFTEPPERQLPGVVASMRARIGALDAEQKRIEAEIAKKFPAFRELTRPSVPSPDEIAGKLKPDEAFLLVTSAAEGTHVWALSRDGFEYSRSPMKAADLATAVQRLRTTMDLDSNDKLAGFDAAVSANLYRSLVAPVEKVLDGKTGLHVSAGGALAKIPFAVLLTEETKSDNPAEHPYLIRKLAVSHVVSPAAWLAQVKYERRTKQATSGFAGFGDPVFSANAASAATTRRVRNLAVSRVEAPAKPDAPAANNVTYASLSPLPETREEILAIASALRADPNRDVFLSQRATRRNVLESNLSDRSVLVFATHGLMAGDLPTLDEPGLALSVSSAQDGNPILGLSDVLKLRLNADWVVLSACNTAAGDKASDETYSGLGRGFFYAGARALLLTHWAVETHSAKALTTQLFERFSSDSKITRAEALRQAQLFLIASKSKGGADHAHPFFWAPFALVGDGGR